MNNPSLKKVALLILDGFGLSDSVEGNATKKAQMPFYQKLLKQYPHASLITSGPNVGLPEGQMGNSEVGHLNIGAGRIVYQSLTEIDNNIQSGDFFQNPQLLQLATNIRNQNATLHLVGLFSHGGVHSSITHLFALLKFAKEVGIQQVCIHALLDGRDTAMKVALEDLQELESMMSELQIGTMASIGGRFYGMDRDKNWERTQKFYDAIAFQKAPKFSSAKSAIEHAYKEGESDEFMTPCIIRPDEKTSYPVKEEDVILFFNFRPDRMRQIVRAFGEPSFKEFPTLPFTPHVVTFTEYDRNFSYPILFPPRKLLHTLGEILAENHLSQLRAAETEKYAHVTFFFNAMKEDPYPLEHRILVPSLKIDSYDKAPEMRARELTKEILEFLSKESISFLLLNYANPDMVGHSGNFHAVVKALEVLDECLSSLVPTLQQQGFSILLTADHGNAEQMINEDGSPAKNHTTFPVPLLFIPSDSTHQSKTVHNGILADLAPTILELLDLPKPAEMTGSSLLRSY